MNTDRVDRIDLDTIKSMAKDAAKKASQERGVCVVGTSTVVATYSGHEKASIREKKNIDRFFKNNMSK